MTAMAPKLEGTVSFVFQTLGQNCWPSAMWSNMLTPCLGGGKVIRDKAMPPDPGEITRSISHRFLGGIIRKYRNKHEMEILPELRLQ